MSKIDIVMATYNGEKYINEQIDSIINQTYTDWNLIIRDDGSKDRTVVIIKEYEKKDSRIKLIEDDLGNLGFNKNFEKLLTISTEDYIMISDQDDIWNENKIEITYKEMKKIEKINTPTLVFCDSFLIDNDKNILGIHIGNKIKSFKKSNILMAQNICQGATILMNRCLVEKALPFSENISFDYYIFLLSELLGTWSFLESKLLSYRIHENNAIGIQKKREIKHIIIDSVNIYSGIFFYIKSNFNTLKETDTYLSNEVYSKFCCLFKNEKSRFEKLYIVFSNGFFTKKVIINIVFIVNILSNNLKCNIIDSLRKRRK